MYINQILISIKLFQKNIQGGKEMLLFDMIRNIIFIPISYVLDYEVIDEDKDLIEEKKLHQNYEPILAT